MKVQEYTIGIRKWDPSPIRSRLLITFHYPTKPLLDVWDTLRVREREYDTGRPSPARQLRVLLREAGFTRARASGGMAAEAGSPTGTLEESTESLGTT